MDKKHVWIDGVKWPEATIKAAIKMYVETMDKLASERGFTYDWPQKGD